MVENVSPRIRVAVAWYRESQWDRLRQLAADPEKLEETYAEWTRVYEDGIRKLEAVGLIPERAEIDVEELQIWCTAQNCALDGSARAAFASEIMRRRSRDGSSSTPFPRFWRD